MSHSSEVTTFYTYPEQTLTSHIASQAGPSASMPTSMQRLVSLGMQRNTWAWKFISDDDPSMHVLSQQVPLTFC